MSESQETQTPDKTPDTPLPPTTNISLHLLGYLVDYKYIFGMQYQLRYDPGLSLEERIIKTRAITQNVQDQFASLKELLIANLACEKCRQSPLVVGSKHALFTNPDTKDLWDELVDAVETIKAEPTHITPDHLAVIRWYFQQIEKAYRRDDVAATC